ncbi:MAG: BlaR1 family beta-lactam sensor/signal transducer [Eubacterium sp.]|nr:BlaR1 family beta-lactam sensor/signal transducer [Eubacterium sp.]
MADFMIAFLICNVWLSLIAGMLFAVRRLFGKYLTSRTAYHLWFLLLGACLVPLLPLPSIRMPQAFAVLKLLCAADGSSRQGMAEDALNVRPAGVAGWAHDIGISVTSNAPSGIGQFLFCLWIAGAALTAVFFLRHTMCFRRIRQSALPLQNADIRSIYRFCLREMQIKKEIPVYSTAFLRSPVIAGFFKPCIYLPIQVICDCPARQVRYMLLHELSHYRHRDTLVQLLMKLTRIVYWFHPVILYALSQMHTDRETACDASVLKLLHPDAYADYGNTLLDLAQHVSAPSFPSAAGIGGTMAQIKKRVLHIAAYQPATKKQRAQSTLALLLTAAAVSAFLPLLSTQAADNSRYFFSEQGRQVRSLDLAEAFGSYNGSFVLYDTADNSWQIYQKDAALTRMPPASTYKIYSALLGLETGTITPDQSVIRWNGRRYSYESWNADQDLTSAMKNSVNWYFQAIDTRAGMDEARRHIQKIGYGNQMANNDPASYWTDGTLKISPVEQVELLQKFYHNAFGFAPEHIEAVKQAIQLESDGSGALYGKTGTVACEGNNISGWLVGFVEKGSRTCFFATNIQKESHADGSAAAQLTLDILAKLHIWK